MEGGRKKCAVFKKKLVIGLGLGPISKTVRDKAKVTINH